MTIDETAPSGKAKTKIVIIGLDGGTFTIIDPLIAEGKLPNIARLIEEGARGPLQSVIPPVTGPAWTSFMTGKEPGRHGLFDFVKPVDDGYGREVVNYSHIRARTIWSILSDAGLTVGIVGVPATWPPPRVKGFVVTGMLTPGTDVTYTHPPELAEEIEEKFGPYILDIWWQSYNRGQEDLLLDALLKVARQRWTVALDLLQSRPCDVFMMVFEATDRIHHSLWHLLDPEAELDAEGRRLRERIVEIYSEIDKGIGRIVDAAGPKANVFIMSDHGFGPLTGKFAINTWLEREGLLHCTGWNRQAVRNREKVKALVKWFSHKITPTATGRLFRKALDLVKKPRKSTPYRFLQYIDWSKTKAYSVSNTESGIYINLEGREPQGIVKPGPEAEALKKVIIEKLQQIKHPETGEYLVPADRVALREEIYDGPFVDNAPDVLFFLKEGEFPVDVNLDPEIYQPATWKTGSGSHRMNGIFCASGPDIRSGTRLEKPRIIDLAPTILGLLDLPIPSDMDGAVLREMLTGESTGAHSFATIEADETDFNDEAQDFTEEEAARVEKQLKDLGYL